MPSQLLRLQPLHPPVLPAALSSVRTAIQHPCAQSARRGGVGWERRLHLKLHTASGFSQLNKHRTHHFSFALVSRTERCWVEETKRAWWVLWVGMESWSKRCSAAPQCSVYKLNHTVRIEWNKNKNEPHRNNRMHFITPKLLYINR